MSRMRLIRNGAFVAMVLCIVAGPGRLLASYDFCSNIPDECSCDGDWNWSGACDFSGYEYPEGQSQDFCEGTWLDCLDACGSPYQEELADRWCDPFDPGPECDPNCWSTTPNWQCYPVGAFNDYSCGCDGYMWCMNQ
jgi:hypothetical protein